MISSILIMGRSELTQIALGNPSTVQHASKVKQYKSRSIGIKNEYIKSSTYYLPFILPLLVTLGKSGRLVFSIDGSVVGRGCICLMFSVIYKGKAIPVVWKVYKGKKGHLPQEAHQFLLEELSKLVPADCRIIITGDGEFDGCDWQQDILVHGWDYVLRTSKNVLIVEDNWDSFKPGAVCLEQGESLFFEEVEFTRKKIVVNLFIWHGKGHEKPIYLVTNLDFSPEIKQFYKKRFKIEPFFRDQKSKGFHIHKSGLSDPQRLGHLLIATCLAYILTIMAGIKAGQSKFYKHITRTDGVFLSLFQLGKRFILHLVDLRQWRQFSWDKDFVP